MNKEITKSFPHYCNPEFPSLSSVSLVRGLEPHCPLQRGAVRRRGKPRRWGSRGAGQRGGSELRCAAAWRANTPPLHRADAE